MHKKGSVLNISVGQKICSIETIIFDLDGTLYPQKEVKKAMIRSCFPHLLSLKKYADYRSTIVGRDFIDAVSMKKDALINLSRGKDKKVAKWQGWLRKKYYPALLSTIASVAPRPGFVKLIQDLHKKGITMAIVSDYGYVEGRLLSLGFDPKMFSLLLGTEEMGAMKPAPRINDFLKSELGLNFSKTLVIGDRADTDQALADQAGMSFMGISDSQNEVPLAEGWYSWNGLHKILKQALAK